MKRFLLEIMGAAVLATGLAYAQRAPAQRSTGATSRVDLWLVDPAGAVDGVLLTNGQSLYFAPDVARTATLSVRITDPVRVDVEGGHRWLVDARDDSRIELLPPPARGGGPRAALSRLIARGEVRTWLRGPDGQLAGFIMGSGEQVRVPASLMPRLLATLRPGDIVTVRGLGTQGPMGTGMEALDVMDVQGRMLLVR